MHVLRSVSDDTGRRSFVLIGSGAIVAKFGEANLPEMMAATEDVDLYAIDTEDHEAFSADVEAIGFGSQYHHTFGYHADGVSPQTAVMPGDWKARAARYTIPGVEGGTVLVPDANDIAIAKLCAWRDKDKLWLEQAAQLKIIDVEEMSRRLDRVRVVKEGADLIERRRRLAELKIG